MTMSRTDVPARWRRALPDSGGLAHPRVLLRHHVPKRELESLATRYEELLDGTRDIHMPIPHWNGLELIAVSNVLLIASERPFSALQHRTVLSAVVADIGAYARRVGVTVIAGCEIEPIPPGLRARCDFGCGIVLEAVEHVRLAGESAVPADRLPRNKIRLFVPAPPPLHAPIVRSLRVAHDLPSNLSDAAAVGDLTVVSTNSPLLHTDSATADLTGFGTGLAGGLGVATVVPIA